MNLKKNQDIYLGIIILVIAAIFWQQAFKIRGNAAMLPKFFLVLISISGFGIIGSAIFKQIKTGKTYQKISLREFGLEIALPGTWLCIICFLFRYLGFYLCSFVFIIGVCLMQDYLINGKIELSAKHAGKLLMFSAGSSLFMFLCFRVVLKMLTPIGVFGF